VCGWTVRTHPSRRAFRDRRGKRAMRLRVRHWRVVLDARENRTALPSSAAETYMPMPRNRSKCGWRRRIGRDDARERAVRAGGGRSAHLRRGFALGVRHRATRRSRTAGRRRVRDAQCRVNSCVNSGSTGLRVVVRWLNRSPGILLSNAELFLSESLAVTPLGTGSR
jgi:hypothetical protein